MTFEDREYQESSSVISFVESLASNIESALNKKDKQ